MFESSFKNKLCLFSLLIILFIVISSVNASEIDDNNITTNELSIDENTILKENISDSFNVLSQKINETSENQTLTLDKDYRYVDGDNHGILISKSITIDGAGHTLDAKKSSRIFNITADNVVLKNIIFINGNALGFYSEYYGGGALYWSGNNGNVENCTFMDNSATGLEVDPYEPEEIVYYGDDGTSWTVHNERPAGASTNQGGAITWIGDNGTISNSQFENNHVEYPNYGGSLYWAGNSGRIINSRFLNNNAYCGSAVYWRGINGTIDKSYFLNDGICDSGIFWAGNGGTVKNSILLKKGFQSVISPYGVNVNANYNFWGDTIENPDKINKSSNVYYWILINVEPKDEFAFEGDDYFVNYDLTKLASGSGEYYKYTGLVNNSGSIKFTANKTGFVKAFFDSNKIQTLISDNNYSNDFLELAQKIRDTPENSTLVLTKDYSYLAGSNKGILISKPIIIDGNGYILDANHLSRMFNITADNVVIKNLNFVNGNAFGQYYSRDVGGGAIYWSGNNGLIENCNFTNNTGYGIENDPFDSEEIIIMENGMIMHSIRVRPMGAKTNEGGAIVWNGINGTVSNCIFISNHIGYPNTGGAICWRGDDGSVINSRFLDNSGWCGAAIAWIGDNGKILSSIIAHTTMFNGGIYWFGHNGVIHNSILLASENRRVLSPYDCDVDADYNFWGDILGNPTGIEKIKDVDNWLVMNATHNGEFVKKGQKITITYEISNLIDKKGNLINYNDFTDELNGEINYTAVKTGYLVIKWDNDKVSITVDSKDKIKSNDLIKYYSPKTVFKVKVSDVTGKVIGKTVKFKINGKKYTAKTNKKGIATLKLKLKPGKYKIYTKYGDAKVKNKITIKTTLKTKNLYKKVKKSAKFNVKVLNSKGKVFKKQFVKIKFKGKIYKLKTNTKGIATFNIPKNLKVGKYTIKTTCNGLTNSNKIIVKK